MFVVYLFLFDSDETEPLPASDNPDSVEKTLMTEVMVIEDYILLTQTGKLVLRIFFACHDKKIINSLYFLDKPSKIRKNKKMNNFQNYNFVIYSVFVHRNKDSSVFAAIYYLIKHI